MCLGQSIVFGQHGHYRYSADTNHQMITYSYVILTPTLKNLPGILLPLPAIDR